MVPDKNNLDEKFSLVHDEKSKNQLDQNYFESIVVVVLRLEVYENGLNDHQ